MVWFWSCGVLMSSNHKWDGRCNFYFGWIFPTVQFQIKTSTSHPIETKFGGHQCILLFFFFFLICSITGWALHFTFNFLRITSHIYALLLLFFKTSNTIGWNLCLMKFKSLPPFREGISSHRSVSLWVPYLWVRPSLEEAIFIELK